MFLHQFCLQTALFSIKSLLWVALYRWARVMRDNKARNQSKTFEIDQNFFRVPVSYFHGVDSTLCFCHIQYWTERRSCSCLSRPLGCAVIWPSAGWHCQLVAIETAMHDTPAWLSKTSMSLVKRWRVKECWRTGLCFRCRMNGVLGSSLKGGGANAWCRMNWVLASKPNMRNEICEPCKAT